MRNLKQQVFRTIQHWNRFARFSRLKMDQRKHNRRRHSGRYFPSSRQDRLLSTFPNMKVSDAGADYWSELTMSGQTDGNASGGMDVEGMPIPMDLVTPACSSAPARTESVRLVVLSDTHGLHGSIPAPLPRGDVLIHLGDFADRGSLRGVRSFAAWFADQNCCPEKLVIPGNHDRDVRRPGRIDLRREFDEAGGGTRLLLDESVVCAGGRLRVHGASWDACERGDFGRVLLSVERPRTDVLLAHVNPYLPFERRAWQGSLALTESVLRSGTPLCCSGHVHRGRGAKVVSNNVRDSSFVAGTSVFANCSMLVGADGACTAPVVIDHDPVDRIVLNVDFGPSLTHLGVLGGERKCCHPWARGGSKK